MSNYEDIAKTISGQQNIVDVSVTPPFPPLHQPFTWLNDSIKSDPNAQFAEDVAIVAMGARTISEILQMQQIDQCAIDGGSTDVNPLLSISDINALTGLLVHSLKNLAVAAEERIDRLYFATTEGAKA
ncbi:hypothetical protein [Massilia sp. DWR3-1-1]|uniref:hypothetical protein n=1 Tax=Massilia sp. DWR3-1-1 TaxID=2804559 RepID=UPI003CED00F1